LVNTFGFNEIQSQLSLGYQFAFAGNTSGAISHVEMADEALEKTIASVFRTGEEVTKLSQNNSLTLDNSTRQILSAGLTDLGSEIRDQFSRNARIESVRKHVSQVVLESPILTIYEL
jgi:hypothetical protein